MRNRAIAIAAAMLIADFPKIQSMTSKLLQINSIRSIQMKDPIHLFAFAK